MLTDAFRLCKASSPSLGSPAEDGDALGAVAQGSEAGEQVGLKGSNGLKAHAMLEEMQADS